MVDRVMQEDGVIVVWVEYIEIVVIVEGYYCYIKECYKFNSIDFEKSTRMNANIFGEISV